MKRASKGWIPDLESSPLFFFTLPSNPPILFPYHPALLQEQSLNLLRIESRQLSVLALALFFTAPRAIRSLNQLNYSLKSHFITIEKSLPCPGIFFSLPTQKFFRGQGEIKVGTEIKKSLLSKRLERSDFLLSFKRFFIL